MNKNEIALSFEQAEYYTLQEACDYLNMKHGINNITIKKILPNILKHNTHIYFYAKGFNATADFGVIGSPVTQDYDKEYVFKTIDKARDYLDIVIHDTGLLLLISNEVLEQLRFSETTIFYHEDWAFCGALHFDNLQGSPFSFDFLPMQQMDIHIISGMSAIYPHFYKHSNDDWDSVFAKSSLKVSEYEIYEHDDGSEHASDAFCKISINDLLILHKDLMELENNIINNNPAPQKQTKIEIKPRKGKSVGKQTAQEQAKIIAKALWNNDKEQKIRIKEMAGIIYSELYDNGFMRDLPNDPISLKDWIKEIAPPHATIGGRPKKEP